MKTHMGSSDTNNRSQERHPFKSEVVDLTGPDIEPSKEASLILMKVTTWST